MKPKIAEIKAVDFDGLVAGMDFFNPAMVKLVMYPVAGAIVVSLGETLVAPLTRRTIRSQLEGNSNNNNNQQQQLGGLEEFLRSEFGYRLSYFGITSLANSCFKHLFVWSSDVLRYNIRDDQFFATSGALSALTASIILLPFKTTSTNKGYTATFRDIWSDGGFRSLFLKAKPLLQRLQGVGGMLVGMLLYELTMQTTDSKANRGVYVRHVMADLTWAVIVSVAPEILRGLGADVERFFHNLKKLFGGEDFVRNKFSYRLCLFGITFLANLCYKPRLPNKNSHDHLLASTVTGLLSAWTGSMVLFPFILPSTNKAYNFKDGCFATIRMTIQLGVTARVVYSCEIAGGFDLRAVGSWALLTMIPEILIVGVESLLSADFEISPDHLWRGNNIMVNIVRSLTYCGVNSFAYLSLRSLLKTYASTWRPKSVAFTSGALASLTASLVSYPLDTLLTHYIADPNPDATWKTTIANLCHKEGDDLQSLLYAGFSASLFSIVPSMTISLVACEAISLLWERPSTSASTTFMFDLARTSIATVTASTVMYPVEVVRRRMQMEKGTKNESTGLLETFKGVLGKGGIRSLYSGINSHLVKVVVGHAIAFTAFELFIKLRSPNGGNSSFNSSSHASS
ncbi:Mitochondrial coenzyme A transporter SLC25A42 [Linum grandiflorum]